MVALLTFSLAAVLACPLTGGQPQAQKPLFEFNGNGYFHRFSENDLHEFTPKPQSDLKTWTDMFTVNIYPKVTDGEGLAGVTNSVLETYKQNSAIVLRTDSVPRTETKPAEHLIVVLFTRPEFIEAAFARFRIQDGHGASLVYSHRVYGKKAGDAMSAWMKKNGPLVEKSLMSLKKVPVK